MAGGYGGGVTKGERESSKFLRIFFFFFFFFEKISDFLERQFYCTLVWTKDFFSCVREIRK